ncbi:hypothetical protein PRZ61_02770 [Halomonas pacifica]|uniref:Uncharacterized protein n=1 Tax=Bisbaumannia pacifica TaxID=77098 RepID=A0A510XBZ4_9GAMM|nr:hypothetical protein [Halomonas pacifica]MDC8802376.1 hypothetical protein [Halomonas pacifica]GEK48551.1 hypothetical protein HPA02_28340 [Halomonas pacifica]
MSADLNDFEESIRREIDAFTQPKKTPAPKPSKPAASGHRVGYRVKLAVRPRQLALDEVFEYESSSISKLEAQLEAEKAARRAGYPIIGYLIDIERL